MNGASEMNQILPLPLLKITDEYIGTRICMDEWLYEFMVNNIALYISSELRSGDYSLLKDVIKTDAAQFIFDIIGRMDSREYYFLAIYYWIPSDLVDEMLDRFGYEILTEYYGNGKKV